MTTTPFTFDHVFSATDAREDKIDLELRGWSVYGIPNAEEHEFKSCLSSPPAGSEDFAWKTQGENEARFGWFFLRPEREGKNRDKLLIRKQALVNPQDKRRHEAPLCGGYCLFYQDRNWKVVRRHQAKLRLSLNVQRFIRHQFPSDDASRTVPPRLHRRREARSCHGDEFALDGQDNWLPASASWTAARKAEHLGRYLMLITDEVQRNLKRACHYLTGLGNLGDEWADVDWQREDESYRLEKVETLWEFPSDDPIGDVLRIGHKLMHFNCQGAVAREFSRVRNSPCFDVPIGEDVRLKLYAKTNRRIRFEVVQSNLGKRGSELRKTAGIASDDTKDAPRPFDEIPKVIKALRVRATNFINKVMEDIRGVDTAPVKACSVVDLLSEVSTAVYAASFPGKRQSDLRTLLFFLCYQRGYRGQIKRGPLHEALSTLTKRGVLVFDRSRQFYKLAKAYEGAADALFLATGDPILTVFGLEPGQFKAKKPGERPIRLREDD